MNTKSMMDKAMMVREDTVDSGSLASLASVIHKVPDSGDYRGVVYRGPVKVGTFSINVSQNGDAPTDCEKSPRQLNIDLTTIGGTGSQATKDCGNKFMLRAGGNIVFTALSATGGYAVELFRREKGKESEKVFDSRKLVAGDLFIVHVMRPGTYSIKDINAKGQTELTVEYPDAEKLKMKADPFLVEFNGEEIVPSKITVQPVQALMFNPQGETRITIELKKADDRPAMVRAPIVTMAKTRKKKAPAVAGQKQVLRQIRFYG